MTGKAAPDRVNVVMTCAVVVMVALFILYFIYQLVKPFNGIQLDSGDVLPMVVKNAGIAIELEFDTERLPPELAGVLNKHKCSMRMQLTRETQGARLQTNVGSPKLTCVTGWGRITEDEIPGKVATPDGVLGLNGVASGDKIVFLPSEWLTISL